MINVVLKTKLVEVRTSYERTPPRPFEEVWGALQDELSHVVNDQNENRLLPSAEVALSILKNPLTAEYSEESNFDKALFESLRDCLGAYELKQDDPNAILFNVGSAKEYAVGIARRKSPAFNLLQADACFRGYCGYFVRTSTGMIANSALGHAVYLFKNDNGKWTATDCFSVVEPKLSTTTCRDFDHLGFMSLIDFEGKHAALGQVIMHNMGSTLLYRAKWGVLGRNIPLAILAGKKKRNIVLLKKAKPGTKKPFSTLSRKETRRKISCRIRGRANDRKTGYGGQKYQKWKRNVALRWVSESLEIPVDCGGLFHYSLQDYGDFIKDREEQSVNQALSVYMETILFGLDAAIAIQNSLAEGKIPQASPASGQSFMIGDVTLNLQFVATPIPGAVMTQDETILNRWSVSQGGLFSGRLDVREVLRHVNTRFVHFLSNKHNVGMSDVVVKVSSITVHNLFLDPAKAFFALVSVKQSGQSLVDEVGSVLLATIRCDAGLITIMEDLTKQGYGLLQPKEDCVKLPVLWGAFQELVERVLVPMAEIGLVHADIRPGYDITANILCKLERGNAGTVKATMKLVDYESIVHIDDLHNLDLCSRHIRKEPDRCDATTYLWWQCMAVAYTWKEELDVSTLRIDRSLEKMRNSLLGRLEGPAWLVKYRDNVEAKVSSTTLRSTLVTLGLEFDTHP